MRGRASNACRCSHCGTYHSAPDTFGKLYEQDFAEVEQKVMGHVSSNFKIPEHLLHPQHQLVKEKDTMPTIEIIPQTTGFLVKYTFGNFKLGQADGVQFHAAETYASAAAKGKKLLDEAEQKKKSCKDC